jgi:hypothetical protein
VRELFYSERKTCVVISEHLLKKEFYINSDIQTQGKRVFARQRRRWENNKNVSERNRLRGRAGELD